MDRANQTWELIQQLLANDPELDPAVLAIAHLGPAAVLFEQCDPEMADAILATVESVIGPMRLSASPGPYRVPWHLFIAAYPLSG